MKSLKCIAIAIFLVAAFEWAMSEKPMFKTLHIKPQPKTYSMQIREIQECVSCNSNDGARKDYVKCLQGLSEENKKLAKSCCTKVFDNQFCDKASHGEINFALICSDPRKGIEVSRCFWKQTNKNTHDIAQLRQCKLNLLNQYCTTKSGDQ